MQQYYNKFQNLSENNQRRILVFTSLLLNWVFFSYFPINALLIYILTRGFTINNTYESDKKMLVIARNMYSETLYLVSLSKYYFYKLKSYKDEKNLKQNAENLVKSKRVSENIYKNIHHD